MPLPQRREWAIGLSLANLCFIGVWAEILGPAAPSAYFLKVSVADYVAAFINVTVLGTAFAVGAATVRRGGKQWTHQLARVALLAVFVVPLNRLRVDLRWMRFTEAMYQLEAAGGLRRLALLVLLVMVAAVFLRWLAPIARAAALALLVLSPFVVATFGQAAWAMFADAEVIGVPDKPLARSLPASPHPRPRVLVVLFDEMDQRLAFAERPPDLRLPELDRLRAEAVSATKAFPPGSRTETSVPALLTGRYVSASRPMSFDELGLTFDASANTARFSTQPTLFSAARSASVNAGIVGWHHPYCRLMNRSVTRCYWQPNFDAVAREPRANVRRVIRDQWVSLLPWGGRQFQIDDFIATLAQAKALVSDTTLGLMYVHLPVPHLPGIFDRSRGAFSVWTSSYGSYLDNLALADRAMGELRRAMETTGTWKATTVLVTSDHSWRQSARFDGRRDLRVPFVLRLAGMVAPVIYDRPFNTIVIAKLVPALLRGHVRTVGEAVAWLDARARSADARPPEPEWRGAIPPGGGGLPAARPAPPPRPARSPRP